MKRKKGADTCGLCAGEQFSEGTCTFEIKEGNRLMLIENVPGLICQRCQSQHVKDEIRKLLTVQTKSVFARNHSLIFIFQFSDLVREQVQEFKLFDTVRVRQDVDTWDAYDEDLKPGAKGTVVGGGDLPFYWQVEFCLDKKNDYWATIDIDEADLELVSRIATEATKQTKRELAEYKKTLANSRNSQ